MAELILIIYLQTFTYDLAHMMWLASINDINWVIKSTEEKWVLGIK